MAHRPLLILLAVLTGAVPAGHAVAGVCWPPPVRAPVVDPYRPPACRWCPGHRGVTFGASRGQPVHAVAAGRVTFAGTVAGTEYVVVAVANGWRLTYGNLADRRVAAGALVVAGTLLGSAAGPLHFGLRDRVEAGDDAYLDPTPHLGEWRFRARLIPLEAAPAGRARAPVLTCPQSR